VLVLTLLACAHRPGPTDYLPQILTALSLAEAVALAQPTDDPAACVGWGLVAATAPVVSSTVLQAHLGEVVEIPTLVLDLSCVGEPPVPERALEVAEAGLSAATTLLPLWTAPEDCRARAAAEAALGWARGAQVEGWRVVVPAVAVAGC
jgi:hypothetical protein